jgi:glycosyltransferase involved in cell wall biosynthesis
MDETDSSSVTTSPRRRKVLVLIKCMGYGGAEQLVVSTIRHGDRERFDYEVAYVLEDRDALVPQLRDAGVVVHSLGARGSHDLRWTRNLRSVLVRNDFDVVHSHLPYAAAFGRLVATTLGSPRPALVYTEHGIWDRMALAVKAMSRVTERLDDRLLTVSEAAREALPPALRRRARVVYPGIELEPIDEARRRKQDHRRAVRAELGLAEGELLALTVANLRWQKGHDILLRAAKSVTSRGLPVRFVFVGDGPRRRELELQRASLSLDDQVLFLGDRDDVPRLLAAADLFVLPSRFESLGLALIEAVCSGLPVVATAVGEIPNLGLEVGGALVVPPEQAEALAEALESLVRDGAQRTQRTAAALALAERFDVRRSVREVESVYDELSMPARLA